jgi:hypothetical protein
MGSLCSAMPFQRHLRWALGALTFLAVAGAGLADWSGGDGLYTVRPGDSLWSIARAHHTTVATLAALNALDPADILPIGVHLKLPDSGGSPRPAPVAAGSPWAFCADFQQPSEPYGVLPAGLAGTSAYYEMAPLFSRWASYYGLYRPLLEAVAWQESGWQQDVVSPTGAVGVGQIEPYTASFIASDLVGESLDLNSASDNIRMSAAFLAYLAHREGNNACATIAAYYEGPLELQTHGVLPDTAQYVADVEALEARFS